MICTSDPTCSDGAVAIEADVARHGLSRGKGVQSRCIGDLVDIAAIIQQAQQIGIERRHFGLSGPLSWVAARSTRNLACKRMNWPPTQRTPR